MGARMQRSIRAVCESARRRFIARSSSSTKWPNACAVSQDWDNDVRIVLFVKLREGLKLDDALRDKMPPHDSPQSHAASCSGKRDEVPDIPRTRNGKLMEVAVRNLINGVAVSNREAAADPEALDFYAQYSGAQEKAAQAHRRSPTPSAPARMNDDGYRDARAAGCERAPGL